MKDRLLQFLSAENITQSQFADTIGVARASISHILSGRNKPGYDFIENTMKHYPALNIEWLINGTGKMYRNAADTSSQIPDNLLFPKEEQDKITPILPDNSADGRKISKIIVCYSDNTFVEIS